MNTRRLIISSALALSCLCAFHMAHAMRGGRGRVTGNGVRELRRDGTGPHSPRGARRALRRDGSGPNQDGRGPQGTNLGPRAGCPRS